MLAKIEGVNYTAIIGESAKIDVKQAINYIKSGQAEISETVGDIIGEFNNNAVEKTNTFNQNAIDKTAEFDLNASNKTGAFNTNATNKTTNYNDNATSKTGVFDSNAVDKTNDFNLNASNKTTDFNNNYLEKKALIDAEVAKSKTWAEGTDGEVTPLGGTHSAKVWAEIAEDAASGVQNPANRDLSNLTNTGQMIINSQNGTISNCILEIPQNIKLEINTDDNKINIVLGSTLVIPNGDTYTTSQTTTYPSNYTTRVGNSPSNKYLVLFWLTGSGCEVIPIEACYSGTTQPTTTYLRGYWYNTTDRYLYKTSNAGETWEKMQRAWSFPVCVVEEVEGVWQFAKDSNGNDMIFNGAGFIGHHAFVYPNVKGLVPNGFNEDGSLKSVSTTTNILIITELNRDATGRWITNDGFSTEYSELEELPPNPINYFSYYIKSQNRLMVYSGISWGQRNRTMAVGYSTVNNIVTDFTIRQPYEGARNLLTDDIEEEVATKQVDVTTLTGYDATQTQTLKNINGVLTWVTD